MVPRILRIVALVTATFLFLGGLAGGALASQPSPAGLSPETAAVVYNQPANPAGGLIQSSLRDPDGSAVDQWVWDAFTLPWTAEISEIRWTGGFDPARFGSGGAVANFTISIYGSNAPKTEPDLTGPLIRYEVGSNAGQTPGAVLGGVQMYDYHYVLTAPFQALARTKYWVQIEAHQPGPLPDWGLTKGTGGDGTHFQKVAGETVYRTLTGDTTFSLVGAQNPIRTLFLPCIMK